MVDILKNFKSTRMSIFAYLGLLTATMKKINIGNIDENSNPMKKIDVTIRYFSWHTEHYAIAMSVMFAICCENFFSLFTMWTAIHRPMYTR